MKPRKSSDQIKDRRVERTRSLLSEALIELLLERGWNAIGVGELCARANIARSTFYLHFSNKEELLESGFNALRDSVRANSPTRSLTRIDRFRFVEGIASHIFENRKVFLALIGKNGASIVRERFSMLLEKMITEELATCGNTDTAKAHFLAGGFIALAASIIANRNSNAQQFVEKFNSYAAPIIAI